MSAALALATFAVFWPVLGHDFINYDDEVYVTANPHVRGGLSPAGLRWAWTTAHASNWHPLTWISHMLDVELYGLDPAGHHGSGVVLHAAATITLFLLLGSITGSTWRSAAVAALFAIHPLHVQSVAWVAERKDVLSGLLWFLTTAAYVAWTRRPGRWRYGLLLLTFALGLSAKPVLVTLPFTLLLLDRWPLGRWSAGERAAAWPRVREKLPLFALAAASAAITFLAQRAGAAVLAGRPLSERVANAVVAYATYLWKTVWPTGLAVFYPYPEAGPPAWKVLAALALLAAISGVAWRWRRRRPYLLFGWLWYLGTLVPMIGLVQVGKQALADRYTYLPLVGVFVAVVWGLGELATAGRGRAGRWGPAVALALVVVLFGVAARGEVGHWRDSETLFARALAVTRGNAVAHANLGAALDARGQTREALEHYRRALTIDPALTSVRVALARLTAVEGDPEEALALCEQALSARPDDARVANGCGVVLFDQGRTDEAAARFARAVELRPDYAGAHRNLALARARQGRDEEAIVHYREALRLGDTAAGTRNALGLALERLGAPEQALRQFREALRDDPDHAEARYNYGTLLARQGRWDEALEHLSRAVEIRPDHAEAHYNLGAVLHRLGRPEQARAEIALAERLGYAPPAPGRAP